MQHLEYQSWRRQQEQVAHETFEIGKSEWATNQEVEALVNHYEERLTEAGYFFPPEKAPGMKTVFRNLWSRMKGDVGPRCGWRRTAPPI